MNNRLLAAVTVLSCLVLVMLVYEPVYGFFAYRLPVAGSTIDHGLHDIHYEWVEKENGSRHFGTLEEISIVDDGTIEVRFGQNDHGIYRSGEKIYSPPVFSHVEQIRVGQTFVVTCIDEDDIPPHPDDALYTDDGTDITILKYLGLEEHAGIRVYKFLHANAWTETFMPCDWPQVIRYTVDALPVVISDDLMAGITETAMRQYWNITDGDGS